MSMPLLMIRRTRGTPRLGGQSMSGERAPTIEDVATAAHVSRSTVSRVINHDPRVSFAVWEAVTRAIQELAYIPDPSAQALARRRGAAPGAEPDAGPV
ncbi:LacI family DNA-binding transcriptional regulator [Microbacterium wangruii]|uniref:LacI family DNA-binding transcriptional regulator n=2 Tax=Microbacteriaceae TaxID=85023 RepID=UPI0027D91206|nr:LacI family DNA-binding transcriptional regulator [Microbacterium sp. zg.Y1090]